MMKCVASYAPINTLPHYPPLGQCVGNTGEFDSVLNKKCAFRVGNLTSNFYQILTKSPVKGIV